MDWTADGYEFFFEIEPMDLLYGKYTHFAKITRILDSETRTVVAADLRGEVYGRNSQEARKAAQEWATEWAAGRRGQANEATADQ